MSIEATIKGPIWVLVLLIKIVGCFFNRLTLLLVEIKCLLHTWRERLISEAVLRAPVRGCVQFIIWLLSYLVCPSSALGNLQELEFHDHSFVVVTELRLVGRLHRLSAMFVQLREGCFVAVIINGFRFVAVRNVSVAAASAVQVEYADPSGNELGFSRRLGCGMARWSFVNTCLSWEWESFLAAVLWDDAFGPIRMIKLCRQCSLLTFTLN